MKTRIIRLAIGFTALVAGFLPQKAEAIFCKASCPGGECVAIGWTTDCTCDADGNPVCST